MGRFAEICAGISLKVSENLKAYILQAIAANEGTDCRFVLNSKEIERFSVAMHMKISLRAAFAYLLIIIINRDVRFRHNKNNPINPNIILAELVIEAKKYSISDKIMGY